jgi:hypothetical protein
VRAVRARLQKKKKKKLEQDGKTKQEKEGGKDQKTSNQ